MVIDANKSLNDILRAEEGIREFNAAFETAASALNDGEFFAHEGRKAAVAAFAKLEDARMKAKIFLNAEIEIEEALSLL